MLPEFTLHRPGTVAEALELLETYGDEATLYAGGTELILVMKLGMADYTHLVDVKAIPELQRIDASEQALAIGAGVTHRTLEHSPVVAATYPTFAELERQVANVRVRNVGTLGGNLCFADPHSDPATFLLAADAVLEARDRGGALRQIPAADFWLGLYETALRDDELLEAVVLPRLSSGATVTHERLVLQERPTATVSVFTEVVDGVVVEARVAVGSVGPAPTRCGNAEEALHGASIDELSAGAAETVAAAAAADVSPAPDERVGEEYRRNVVQVLVSRCLRTVVDDARAAEANPSSG